LLNHQRLQPSSELWDPKLSDPGFFFGGRPGDNITMGDLIDRNLRMVVFTVGWRDVMLGGFFFNSARCGVKPRAGLISYLGVFK